uniref:C-type lectin domain-containing protein n=1 Tax=Balaenoptera musculus TaxID=9771 RepID=A0A8C0DXD3_BALMU
MLQKLISLKPLVSVDPWEVRYTGTLLEVQWTDDFCAWDKTVSDDLERQQLNVRTSRLTSGAILFQVRNTKPVSYVLYVTCPKEWIGFGSKCFYFSEDTRNWTFSKTFCTSLEAVLAQFETEEELNFLKRYKGPSDHWLGLRRESSKHGWKWTDSTEYNASFVIKGVGECAYLNDIGLSSARNYTHRNWICSKTNNNVSIDLNTLRTF